MTTYGYIREPITRTLDEGNTAEAQERTLADYATTHGLKLDRVYVERGVSGRVSFGDRPEGKKLMTSLTAGDTLITPKFSDLFHSARAANNGLEQLWGQSVAVHILDLGGLVTVGSSKAFGAMLKTLVDAEHSRDRERSASIKRSERKKGKYLGGPVPFGFKVNADGQLVEEPGVKVSIGRMQAMRQEGKSLRAITAVLNANGVNINHETVRKLLKKS